MNHGTFVFAQLKEHLPLTTFRRCVACYHGEHKVKRFSGLDQCLCMAFAQLTYRESLRDIEVCLRVQYGADKGRVNGNPGENLWYLQIGPGDHRPVRGWTGSRYFYVRVNT